MAALGDLLASRRTGQRTTFGMDIPAAARATVSAAVTEGPRRAADYILGREVVPLEGLENAGAETQAQKAQLEASNTGFRLLDLYVNTVFNTLQAEDALFKVYAFRRELSDIARAQATAEHRADASVSVKGRARELRANPTDAMLVEAAAYADYATFQNPNKVSAAIAGGKRLLGPAGKFLIEQIAPFDRTPTNIILRALENSPVGLVSAALKYRRIGRADAAQALADAALTRAQQKDFARTFGRATTGTALAALAMALAAAGLLSGAIDYDDDRDEYLEKKRAFGGGGMLRVPGTRLRVYIGDTPVGKAMATAAAMWEAMRKPAADEQAGGVLRAGLRVALDQPLVKGLKDVSETESVAEALGAYARSYVPASAFMEHAGEVLDPQQRKFFYGKDDKASFDEKFGAQIRKAIPPGVPGGRDGLPVNPNADAGERGGVGRRLLREFDPFNTTTEREVVRMSGKAAEAFEEAEKNPYRPKDELAIAGKKRQLSADVKQRLERDVRLLTDERVREFLNPPAGEKGRAKRRLLDLYETGTEEYRKGVLTQIQKEASAEVRKKFYEEWGRSNADLIKKEREEDRHNRQAQKEELQRRRLERGDAPKNQRAVISPEEARRAVERLRGGANTPR
jgi:hypothetical protein